MSEKKEIILTNEGKEKLEAELSHLVSVTRKEVSEKIKEARSFGDLSENAEYDAAKDAQAETEERISEIEEILRTAVIVDETDEGDDTVQTGRTVTIKDLVLGITATYKIVGTTEADPLNGKLSNASLVGEHLIGCKAGDKIEFLVPEGMAKYEILEVKR